MSTTTHSEDKLSYRRTFDDTCKGPRLPLLFRRHHDSCATRFDEKLKILVASSYETDENAVLRALEGLRQGERSFFIDVDVDVEAVRAHVASWKDKNRDKSNFISLTYNVIWVLWKSWYRVSKTSKTQSLHLGDFKMVVLKSSELHGRAKLGDEILREEHGEAYRFAISADEVIVAKIVQPEAILGAVVLSQIQDFIPSWILEPLEKMRDGPDEKKWPFSFFREEVKPPNDESECIEGSLRLALAILAPTLAQSNQENVIVTNTRREKRYVSPCRTSPGSY